MCPSSESASSSAADRRREPTASSARSRSKPSASAACPSASRRVRLARPALHRRAARADDRRGLAHPPRRRRTPRHLAPRHHREPESLENTVAALTKLKIDALGLHRRRRHGAQRRRRSRAEASAVVQVPKSIDNDLWLPLPLATSATKPRAMSAWHRQEPDGGRPDDWPLVSRRDDGPPHRAFDARHRQGSQRDLHDHPGGISGDADLALGHRRHRRGQHHQAPGDGQVATASSCSPKRSSSASARARSPSCRTSIATHRATSA